MSNSLRVAVVHDWLTAMGGAEYTLRQILALFPGADVYTIVDTLPAEERGWLEGHRIFTSPLQKFPFLAKRYRYMIWMMPCWIEQFDLGGYDLIISDSHAVAKGVIVHPHQKHLAYIYSPMRYAWDMTFEHDRLGVLGGGIKRALLRRWFHRFRIWDAASSLRPDRMIAISGFIRSRVRKSWGREAEIIYPPVDVEACPFGAEKGEYYVSVSRLVPYKRVDLIVEAFRAMPEKKAMIIGSGPLYDDLSRNAPQNVTITGYMERAKMLDAIAKAKGFIFMPREDFGIAPVEAQACGTPVIAYGHGGASETVRGLDAEHPTGLFVQEQSAEALIEAIETFENNYEKFNPEACRKWAERFSEHRFREEFKNSVETLIKETI